MAIDLRFPKCLAFGMNKCMPSALWHNNGNGSSDICGCSHCKLSFAIAMLTYLRVVRYALYRLDITWFIKGIMKHKPTSNCTITPTRTERVTFQFNPTYHLATGATSVGSFPHTYILEMTCSPYRSIVIYVVTSCYIDIASFSLLLEKHVRSHC